MPPTAQKATKRSRDELPKTAVPMNNNTNNTNINNSSDSILSGTVLHNKPDSQLMPFLFACHRILRAAASPFPIDSSFVSELTSPRYLKSSIAGVQQMTGCLLADVVRLAPTEKAPAALVDHADDILACLSAPFETVARGEAPLSSCGILIERAAVSHIFLRVIPHCRRQISGHLNALFVSVQFAAGDTTGTATALTSANAKSNSNSNSTGNVEGNGKALTGMAAMEMTRVLIDVLHATHAVTPEQLTPLLNEITAASPALQRRQLAATAAMHSSSSSSSSSSASANAHSTQAAAHAAVRLKTRSPGAVIAARVLVEQVDVIQPAIARLALDTLEHGVAQIASSELSNDADAKRRGIRDVSRVMDHLVALTELHLGLVAQLMPGAAPYLDHDNTDVRLLLLRGVAAALSAHEGAAALYRSTVTALFTRFADAKPALRIEMIQCAVEFVRCAAGPAKEEEKNKNKKKKEEEDVEERWRDIAPQMERRLIDANALVRRAAVIAYGEIVHSAPSLLRGAAAERLERTLGLRVADKNQTVRHAAVEQLSAIYRAQLLPWIPNVVMRCLNAEGGAAMLEAAVEAMLPPPTKIAPSTTGTTGTTGTTTRRRSSSGSYGRHSGKANVAVFDFEQETAARERTFAEGLARLCAHLNEVGFARLLAVAAKKVQLRLAIHRLFELRSAVRRTDLKSPEGQDMINNIHRLLSFLQSITHADRGEWDALFRAKDDKVAKAFLTCCAEGTQYGSKREALIANLKGRVDSAVLRFVQMSLARQMMLPLEPAHVEELLAQLKDFLDDVCAGIAEDPKGEHGEHDANEEEKDEAGGKRHKMKHKAIKEVHPETEIPSDVREEVNGILRALLVIARTAPSFLPRCGTPLINALALVSRRSCLPSEWLLSLLRIITEWADAAGHAKDSAVSLNEKDHLYTCSATDDANNNDADLFYAEELDATLSAMATANTMSSLARLCTGPAAGAMRGAVSKQSARLFLSLFALLSARAGTSDPRALSRLVDALRTSLRHSSGPSSSFSSSSSSSSSSFVFVPAAVGWLKALTALAKDRRAAPLVQDECLVKSIAALLSAAAGGAADALAADVTDAAAKCLSAIALSYGPERAPGAIGAALAALLDAYKAAATRDTRGAGIWRGRWRLAVNKQLAKLVARPSADIGRELAVAVILSAEDEAAVRQPVQQKMARRILQGPCDMRYCALLILTAIGEDTKQGFQQLRALVQQVGDHLRTKQSATGATLSSPGALGCFLEYAIPFLVLFMAHHTFYSSEEENHFVAFQRVWHLLFHELFRHGTHCASFVVELFSRIKQSDDVLERESHAMRVLCDLGSRVMHECLGQRQISAEALKRYPGRVLLPNFFVPSKCAPEEALGTVYLDAKVHIASHAPFRPPTNTSTNTNTNTNTCAHVVSGATPHGGSATASLRESAARNCGAAASSPSRAQGSVLSRSDKRRVDAVLDKLMANMTRREITELPWNVVQRRILEAMAAKENDENEEEKSGDEDVEGIDADNESGDETGDYGTAALMEYAMEHMKVRYENAVT